MVRAHPPRRIAQRAGVIRLTVTGAERLGDPEGGTRLVALHGVNAGRPWRLTLADAITALGTGRYFFEVEAAGERRRAELLGTGETKRLYAASPEHGDLLDALPDPSRANDAAMSGQEAAAQRSAPVRRTTA